MYKIIIDDENQTVLAENLSLYDAERELCRDCDEYLDVYMVEEDQQ